MKVRRQKFGVFSLIFLLLFGVIFIAAGFFAINSSKIDPTWTRISGEVIDVSSRISDGTTLYTPIVQYSINGQNRKITSNNGSSFYPNIGDTREIAYNPNRPDQAKIVEGVGTLAFLWLFPLIGLGVLILAPTLFIKSLQRSNKIKNLMQTGQKLQGVMTEIQSVESGKNTQYKIVVSAIDPAGSVQNYLSDTLSGVAGLAMADFQTKPIPIDVYLDPINSKNYYVDVSDIPNLTPERIGELIKSTIRTKTSDK